jgi:hypothetical protein
LASPFKLHPEAIAVHEELATLLDHALLVVSRDMILRQGGRQWHYQVQAKDPVRDQTGKLDANECSPVTAVCAEPLVA